MPTFSFLMYVLHHLNVRCFTHLGSKLSRSFYTPINIMTLLMKDFSCIRVSVFNISKLQDKWTASWDYKGQESLKYHLKVTYSKCRIYNWAVILVFSKPIHTLCFQQPTSKFLDWWIWSTPAQGCRTGPPATQSGVPVRLSYARVDFNPQSGIYEFGYRSQVAPRFPTLPIQNSELST